MKHQLRLATMICLATFILILAFNQGAFGQIGDFCYRDDGQGSKKFGNGPLVDGHCPGVAEYPANDVGLNCYWYFAIDAGEGLAGKCRKLAPKDESVNCSTFRLKQITQYGNTICVLDEMDEITDEQNITRTVSVTSVDIGSAVCVGK